MRNAIAAALLGVLAALPAAAQDRGGVALHGGGPQAVLDRIQQLQPGCPLSQTNIAVGVNRAFGKGSFAGQQTVSKNAGCRPLSSTQVTAGVNLALGAGSVADQSIAAQSPRGLLSTTNVARGVNIAAGRGSSATQGLLSVTGR